MEELKSCPFCGNKAILRYDDLDHHWVTYCSTPLCCHIFGGYLHKENAIANWNTRTPSSSNGLNLRLHAIAFLCWDETGNIFNVVKFIDAICQEFKQTSVPETMGGFPIDKSGVNPLARQTSGLEKNIKEAIERIKPLIDSGYWDSSDLEDIEALRNLIKYCESKFGVPAVPSVEEIISVLEENIFRYDHGDGDNGIDGFKQCASAIHKMVLGKGD